MINQCQNAFRGNYLQRYNPMIGPSLLKARPKMQSQASAAISTMNKSSMTIRPPMVVRRPRVDSSNIPKVHLYIHTIF